MEEKCSFCLFFTILATCPKGIVTDELLVVSFDGEDDDRSTFETVYSICRLQGRLSLQVGEIIARKFAMRRNKS